MLGKQQLGFMKGVGTVDGIFFLRQLMEKCREKQKALLMVFIDMEKAYDRVPRQEIGRSLREKGVMEKYVRITKETYRRVTTCVRSKLEHLAGFR